MSNVSEKQAIAISANNKGMNTKLCIIKVNNSEHMMCRSKVSPSYMSAGRATEVALMI